VRRSNANRASGDSLPEGKILVSIISKCDRSSYVKEILSFAFGRGIIAPSAGGFSPPLPGIGNQREGVLDEIVYPIKMLTDNGDCASFPRASLACRAKLIKQPRARGLARKSGISIVVDSKHTKHAENVKGRLANPRELWEHNLHSTLESCGSPILRTARVRNNPIRSAGRLSRRSKNGRAQKRRDRRERK